MAGSLVNLPSDTLSQFDELYSVSDLHMGGWRAGSQIFDSRAELKDLVAHVKARKAAKIAFVINGDMVDFLAQDDATPFDPGGAVKKLERIVKDFQPVWDALADFVATPGRYLILTLGNHDLELALPWVRSRLLAALSDGNDAALGRITLAFDGAGFLCRVGNATVLCLHGNEVDDWNLTDHETIRRFGKDVQHGRPVEAWVPNAGTHLVIEVMNEIKREYPFVDLLKPEIEGVVPTLLALAPDKRDRIYGAFPVLARLAGDKLRRALGFLGAAEEDAETLRPAPASERVGATPLYVKPRMSGETLLAQTERRLLEGVAPMSLVQDDKHGEYLGVPQAIANFIFGGNPVETLRQAIEGLSKDRGFDWSAEDDTYRQVNEQVSPDIDFVLTGHTHLERALPRRDGRGYFNSGTWARLIRLEPQVLADAAAFAKIYGAFKAGTMEALDNFPGLVMRRCTVVAIRPAAGGGTRGELLNWRKADKSQKMSLEPVDPRAGFTRP